MLVNNVATKAHTRVRTFGDLHLMPGVTRVDDEKWNEALQKYPSLQRLLDAGAVVIEAGSEARKRVGKDPTAKAVSFDGGGMVYPAEHVDDDSDDVTYQEEQLEGGRPNQPPEATGKEEIPFGTASLAGKSEKEALSLVKQTSDLALLEDFKQTEKRKAVVRAIDEQIKAVTSPEG